LPWRDSDDAPQNHRASQGQVLARIAQVTEGGLYARDLDALIRRVDSTVEVMRWIGT
jgi:hypothetical protein